MPRYAQPYSLRRRKDTGYFFYKLKGWKDYRTTGTKNKARALEVVQEALAKADIARLELTLSEYAGRFFLRETCPRVQHLEGEGKKIGNRHLKEQRIILDKYILEDPLADKPLEEIRRGDLLDFRSRLMAEIPGKLRTVNRVMGVLKLIFGEAVYREDLENNPAAGIGQVKYPVRKSGVFTLDELKKLFPAEGLGPWADKLDYAVFLLAASTGMRRGEILALRWMDIDFDAKIIHVRRAWKDREETGAPKSGEARTTPIILFADRVIETLQRIYERSHNISPVDLVFCYGDGARLGPTWWKKRFYKGMEKAKIDRVGRHLTAHGFRRTLNSLLLASNKDSAKIRAALGWKQEATQEGYTELKAADLDDLRLDAAPPENAEET